MSRALRNLCLMLAMAGMAMAHPAPNSTLRLDFDERTVRAEYWLPVSELALARAGQPETALPDYLLHRLVVRTTDGGAWSIEVLRVREDRYLDHDFLVAELRLSPPEGVPLRPLVITDDVITHEVRNHLVFVVENRAEGNRLIGMLQYPARQLEIPAP